MEKIDLVELKQLVDEGLTGKQIAKRLGVSPSAICQRMKQLNLSLASNVALQKAGEIADRKIDALDQLFKINQAINGELDWILQDKQKKSTREWQEVITKHSAEIRKQLSLQLDIYKTLYDIEAVKQFQEEVLNAIGQASPEIRGQIVRRLQERKAIRGAVDFCRG